MFFIVFLCLCFSLLHSFFATALARRSYFGNNFSKREHKREEEPVIVETSTQSINQLKLIIMDFSISLGFNIYLFLVAPFWPSL